MAASVQWVVWDVIQKVGREDVLLRKFRLETGPILRVKEARCLHPISFDLTLSRKGGFFGFLRLKRRDLSFSLYLLLKRGSAQVHELAPKWLLQPLTAAVYTPTSALMTMPESGG